jgi:hypothetical protein
VPLVLWRRTPVQRSRNLSTLLAAVYGQLRAANISTTECSDRVLHSFFRTFRFRNLGPKTGYYIEGFCGFLQSFPAGANAMLFSEIRPPALLLYHSPVNLPFDAMQPDKHTSLLQAPYVLVVWSLLYNHCRRTGFLFHLIAHVDTCTLGRTPLDEGSTRHRDFHLYNTQHSQQTNIHAVSGIRTRSPRKRAATGYALDWAAIRIG